MTTLDLVVSRYLEPIGWLSNIPTNVRVFLYEKGALDEPHPSTWTTEKLPNIGHEAHTYLHHILTRWESLGDITVFAQGHPFDHASDFHRVLRAYSNGAKSVIDFSWLGFIIDTDDPRGRRLFVPWSKNRDQRELAVDEFHRALFEHDAPDAIPFYLGAQFAVTRQQIHSRSPAFYERAIELAGSFPDAPHCFERLWDRVFGVQGVDPELLNGQLTRYLRSVKSPREASALP